MVAAAWVRIPYYSVGPGPAREVTPLIVFEGRQRYEPAGKLVMTTVRLEQLTPLTAIGAWLDPQRAVVSEERIYGPGADETQEQQRSISEMDQSKLDATSVVLHQLEGYPRQHGEGALIESTVADCPADGQLFPGDIVTAIDGHTIDDRGAASAVIEATPPGTAMDFTLNVDGKTEHASFARERCARGAGPLVGVSMLDAFPFPVTISSGQIGGPSAGLMFALGLYDLLTPGDLTGGRTIAGTGTIDLDGRVGPIGGIVDKVVAAQRAGATVFLAPAADMDELRGVDLGGMRVISVSTFAGALKALGAGTTAPVK